MLGIHRSYNAEAASSYFTNNLSREGDYYLENNVKAYWHGDVARRLGINGKEVTGPQFRAFVQGINPFTGDNLTVRQKSERRAGYDLTLSASKSVSVCWALTKDEQILEAFRTAYKSTLKEIETNVQIQANTSYGRFYENSGSLLAAPFEHYTSRPCEVEVNGKKQLVSDVQLHVHLYLPNVSWSSKNERFQAIELGNIHRQAKYFEAYFHSSLAMELEKAGYATRLTHDRFEIAGISRNLIERFSNRTKVIDKMAIQKGITDKAQKSKLSVLTRNSKSKSMSQSELEQHWLSRVNMEELSDIRSLKGKSFPKTETLSASSVIERSLEHHSERNSAFKKRDILAYAMKISYGSLAPEEIEHALNERTDIVESEIETVPYITTHKNIAEERKLIESAVQGKGTKAAINPYYKPTDKLLNKQQRAAIDDVLNSKDFITVLKGSAGVGKSTMLKSIQQAITSTGQKLECIAPSTQAVSALQSKNQEASTVASFLNNRDENQEFHGKIIAIDEAGMIGTRAANNIIERVRANNGRILMIGDTSQHGPPAQAGDALRSIIEKAKVRTAMVNKVVRQQPADFRSAVESLAKERTLEGYKKLEKIDAIKAEPDAQKRLDAIGNDYIEAIKAKRSAIVISPTHAESNEVNDIIRSKLKHNGIIKNKEREFTSLHNLSFTEDMKKQPNNYQDNQVLRFIANAKGSYRAGSLYEVVSGNRPDELKVRNQDTGQTFPLPIEHHEVYQVFQKQKITLAQGDKIRLTQNQKTKEGTKANNGTTYGIKGFTRTGDIKLDNGKTLSKDTGTFRYAYCETSHSSQGKDADISIVSVSDLSFNTASREQFYVSVSRGKFETRVHTSDSKELKKAIARTERRITALDIAEANHRRIQERHQRNYHQSLNEKPRHHGQNRQRNQSPGRDIPVQSQNEKGRD